MNVLLGFGIVIAALAGITLMVGMAKGGDTGDAIVFGSLGVWGVEVVIFVLAVGLAVIVGVDLSNPIKEGACYRGVGTTSTVFIPAGKVLIPSTTHGVSLLEINCP